MSSKREIRLSKSIIYSIIFCLMLSFVIMFILQNFGTFRYTSENNDGSVYEKATDRIISISYKSQLGTNVTNYDFQNYYLKYQVKDMKSGGVFHSYNKKLQYYIKATFKDFKYVLMLWGLLSLITIISSKLKIKIE